MVADARSVSRADHHLLRTVALAGLLVLGLAWGPVHGGQITVVFRFDDYSARSDTAFEVKLIDAFRRSRVCCTFGVIPYYCNAEQAPPREVIPLSVEKAAILKEGMGQGHVDVAMHGYSHEAGGSWAEFAALDYDEQVRRIHLGSELLFDRLGIRATTFIPPCNLYDRVTLRALREAGFQCLSADRGGVVDPPSSGSLKFLPTVCGPGDLRDAVQWARQSQDADPIIVVLFHGYDFREVNTVLGRWNLADFEEILAWALAQKDITIQSIGQLLARDVDLSPRRFEDNRRLMRGPAWVPPVYLRWLGFRAPPVYLSSAAAQQQAERRSSAMILAYVGTALFYLAAALVTALAGFFLEKAVWRFLGAAPATVAGCVVALPVLAGLGLGLRDEVFGYKCALLVSLSLGLCLGVYWGLFRSRRAAGRVRPSA